MEPKVALKVGMTDYGEEHGSYPIIEIVYILEDGNYCTCNELMQLYQNETISEKDFNEYVYETQKLIKYENDAIFTNFF